ncbi:MAG: TIGR03943 family protein [Chloroflexi bacterium]|nr:TIGR03943 family protein [Chloroflexota bacterium]
MEAIHHTHNHDHTHNHAGENAQAWLKTLILFALGAYFAYNIVSGNLTNYINQRFAWLSYVAVVLFLVLGLASVWELLRNRGKAACSCDHEHITWRALAVVAIPLVLGTLIPSRPLGSAAVDGNISTNAAINANFTAFNSDPLKWNVLDWLRAFNSAEDVTTFNGKQADVIGFVYREATFPDDSFMVARFTVSCCVADASAIGLPVIWNAADDFPQDTWVRVQGAFEVGEFRGDTVPVLRATSVETVAQPEHPYLYP